MLSNTGRAVPDKSRTPHFALAPNGAIGAWTLAGPCAQSKIVADQRTHPASRCEHATSRLIASTSGDFDWAKLLDVPPNVPSAAELEAWLYLERPFDGWLLVSADGRLRIAVDGQVVHRRGQARQRGRGFVPVPLNLANGFHHLRMGLERQGNRSSVSALVRERATGQAPADAFVYLPGASARRLAEQQLDVVLAVPDHRSPLELEVRLTFPSGAPAPSLPVHLEYRAPNASVVSRWHAGELDVLAPLVVHLGPLDVLAAEGASTLVVQVGDIRVERKLWLSSTALTSLERATRARTLPIVRGSEPSKYDDLDATIQAHWLDVAEKMLQPSRASLLQAMQQLDSLVDAIERGKNPLLEPGIVRAFIRSEFDQRPMSALTYVPRGSNASASPKPLVVLLHGYNSNSRRILDAFLGDSPQGISSVDGFVVAPGAHGNTFYRGAGERTVLDTIEWASATYPIDKRRISITGVSMGGTGAAEIAFRHSELFSAAAPLCGYHSYFVRRDTAGGPTRPWERRLMHRFSPASWAESGNDIPLFVAHGTKDLPLENSRVLTSRYAKLGYNLTQDWPELGHAVWKKSYANAAMFAWLTRWQKDTDPARVVVASAARKLGKKFWLQMTRLSDAEEPSVLDARVTGTNSVEIWTRGVLGFRLTPSRHLPTDGPLHVVIDGTALLVTSGALREFVWMQGQWHHAAVPLDETAPVEGPWPELFSSPVVVVYGSQNPSTVALNREIAARLVEPRPGVELRTPVLADVDFSPDSSSLKRVIYVGRPDDHLHLADIQHELPIRIAADAIEVGSTRFTESDVGVAFVYPDPRQRDRLLGVVGANGPEGLWRVLSLPALLPDFVVFDHGTDAAAGDPILGPDAYLRAAGFFLWDWSLPPEISDPFAPKPR